MCRQSDVIVNSSIINCPKIDHANTDFVVAEDNTDKGSGGVSFGGVKVDR